MKNIFVVMLMLCFVALGGVPAFAQGSHHKKAHLNLEMIYGSIVSIDKDKKEIVIKEEKTGENKTYQVNEDSALGFKTGQKVKVKFKAGSSIAESVKAAHSKAEINKKK